MVENATEKDKVGGRDGALWGGHGGVAVQERAR